jgi:flagellar export protein FliJ
MKRFRFSLDKVRDWRRLQEEAARARLELLLDEQRGLIRQILECDTGRSEAEAAALAGVDPLQIGALDQYRDFLDRRKVRLEGESRELTARIEQQRERLVEARRKLELLDRLKGKALEKWRYRFNREIEEQAAESAVIAWRRGSAA